MTHEAINYGLTNMWLETSLGNLMSVSDNCKTVRQQSQELANKRTALQRHGQGDRAKGKELGAENSRETKIKFRHIK